VLGQVVNRKRGGIGAIAVQERLTDVQRTAPTVQRLAVLLVVAWIVIGLGVMAGFVIYKAATQPEPEIKCVPDMFGRGCDQAELAPND